MTKTNFIVSFFAVIACLFACTPFACVYSTPVGAESAVYTISYLDSKTQQSIDTTNSTTITSDILPYYLTKPTQDKTGYNFDYWGYDRVNPLSYDETSDAYYIKSADLSIAQNNSLEIIAYWTPIEYALTFVYDISGVVDPVLFIPNPISLITGISGTADIFIVGTSTSGTLEGISKVAEPPNISKLGVTSCCSGSGIALTTGCGCTGC